MALLAGLLFIVCTLFYACGKEEDNTPPPDTSAQYRASAAVSSNAEATVQTQSGASIIVPIYAVPLTDSQEIGTIVFSIERDTSIHPTIPTGETLASDVYRFSPDGFVFASPVMISIPISAQRHPGEVHIYRVNPTSGEAEEYPGIYDTVANKISAMTCELSPWFATYGPTRNTAAGAIKVTNLSHDMWLKLCVEEYSFTYPTIVSAVFGQAMWAPLGTIGWSNSGNWYLPQGIYKICVEMNTIGTISSPPGEPSHMFIDDVMVDQPWTYWNPVISAEFTFGSIAEPIPGPCPCTPTPTPSAGTGDVQVTLTWYSAQAIDLDLWVTEPSGERCYYSNTVTATGGRLDRDNNCGSYINGRPENIYWATAPAGEYKVEVDWFSDCGNGMTSMRYEVRVVNKGNVRIYAGTITPDPCTIEVCRFRVSPSTRGTYFSEFINLPAPQREKPPKI